MKSGKMVLRPRMSTNLWQLSVPSGPIMAWSSTFRALLREIFFSLWKESCKLNFSGTWGALDHTTLKRQHEKGNECDKESMKSLSKSSKQDFLQEAKTFYRQILFSKLWLGIFSWLFLFKCLLFLFIFYFLFISFYIFCYGFIFYFLAIEEVISSPPYKH